jgi:hypothetical protein
MPPKWTAPTCLGLERGEFNIGLLALAKLARVLDLTLASLVESD